VKSRDESIVTAAFPVIELHHFVFRGPRKTLAELVANNGINAGAVIAQPPHNYCSKIARPPERCPLLSMPRWSMPEGCGR
jgi:hypothetical protein